MSLPSPGVLSGGRVVTPEGVLSPGWIRLAGSRIDAVGPGEPPGVPGLPVTDLRGQCRIMTTSSCASFVVAC